MEVKPTADMAMKYKGVIIGVKSAHFAGRNGRRSRAPWKSARSPTSR